MINLKFEHDDFFVVNKPNNVGFHDENGELGFFNQCASYFSETLYPVHRLDKITSGLLILARNKQAAIWFQQAFEQKHIEKVYIALSASKPKKKQGSVVGDMEKARNSQWKLTKQTTNPAITRFLTASLNDDNIAALRLFLLKPHTGKTHQLRVAMKSLGSAILGDKLYNGLDADRGYLHATAVKFSYLGENIELVQLPDTGLHFQQHIKTVEQFIGNPFDKNWPGKSK